MKLTKFSDIKSMLSRDEMKKVKGGSGSTNCPLNCDAACGTGCKCVNPGANQFCESVG